MKLEELLLESARLDVRGAEQRASTLIKELEKVMKQGSDKPWNKNKPNDVREVSFSGQGLDIVVVYNKQYDKVSHIASWGNPSNKTYNVLIAAVEKAGGSLFSGRKRIKLVETTKG